MQGIYNPASEEEKKMMFLSEMGYTMNEASIAMERCGVYSPSGFYSYRSG